MPLPLTIILTLALDDASQKYFTSLRDRYFPKHCNYLPAHLTLFHKLPASNFSVEEGIKACCKKPPFEIEITGIKNMHTGAAFEIQSARLQQLHEEMQQKLSPYLISNDRKKLWPHITIQNKVTAFKAAQTIAALQQNFTPFSAQAIGIDSWLYVNGPWQKQAEYRFEN